MNRETNRDDMEIMCIKSLPHEGIKNLIKTLSQITLLKHEEHTMADFINSRPKTQA